jgi:hypothetical protein
MGLASALCETGHWDQRCARCSRCFSFRSDADGFLAASLTSSRRVGIEPPSLPMFYGSRCRFVLASPICSARQRSEGRVDGIGDDESSAKLSALLKAGSALSTPQNYLGQANFLIGRPCSFYRSIMYFMSWRLGRQVILPKAVSEVSAKHLYAHMLFELIYALGFYTPRVQVQSHGLRHLRHRLHSLARKCCSSLSMRMHS